MNVRVARIGRASKTQGSVLLVVLVGMTLMGITLASFLHLVSNQNASIQRSQQWNQALAVAEAGIEEAMAHLNQNTTNRHLDGWKIEGTNVVKERSLGENKYRILINKDAEPPLVLVQGHTKIPGQNSYLARSILVGTKREYYFTKAMVAKGQIDLAGNGIRTDSFDSTDPNHSTGKRYDPTKTKDAGDIATNSSVIDSLNVWNADIYGKVSTGPGGRVKIGPNGAVGDKAWHAAGNKGIKDGWFKDDMNVEFPDVEAPFTSGFSVPSVSTTINSITYASVLPPGDYVASGDFSYGSKDKVLITGKVRLVVDGNFTLSGQAQVVLAPGAHLELYVMGTSTSIGGQGVANSTGTALDFSYWGGPKNTSVSMHGNAEFSGTIYAPSASLVLGGGGSTPYDFVGSAIANNVKMNGHFKFHYDEALGKIGIPKGYLVNSWTETDSWTEL